MTTGQQNSDKNCRRSEGLWGSPIMGEKEKEMKQEDKMEVEKEEEEEKAGSDDEVIQVRTDKKIWPAEKGEGRKIG